MKGSKSLKLLIPWIEKACDENRYPGLLEWVDKSSGIFSLSWVHKHSEQWDKTKSQVFIDWASYKRKLGEKDDRDLKAAFRNALRSKKSDLRFVEKLKNFRHWQIIRKSNKSATNISKPKKVPKIKQKKTVKKGKKSLTPIESRAMMDFEEQITSQYSPSSDSGIAIPSPLPPCQTLLAVSPSPQIVHQTNNFSPTIAEQVSFFPPQQTCPVATPLKTNPYFVFPSSTSNHQTTTHNINSDECFWDISSFLEGDQESVVPRTTDYEWVSRAFPMDQSFIPQNNQIPDQQPPDNILCDYQSAGLNSEPIFLDEPCDIFQFLDELPEMERNNFFPVPYQV